MMIISHKELPADNGEGYRRYEFLCVADRQEFVVACEDGQYECYGLPDSLVGDDELMQIAIGEYMTRHDIDPGKTHR